VGLTVWPLGGLEVNIGGQLQIDLTLTGRLRFWRQGYDVPIRTSSSFKLDGYGTFHRKPTSVGQPARFW
jgi:hypothetical protein